MAWCYQLKTAWVPISLLFYASFILIFPGRSITEAHGWAMPSVENPMKIGVPLNTFSDEFVKVEQSIKNTDEKKYSGFCIDVFEEVMKTLNYQSLYKFVEFNGTNEDLVNFVADGTLDGAVGDIMTFAYRWKDVKITQPFTSLGMSMVVPVDRQVPNKLLFLTPFTMEVWLATSATFMHTMFTVWFMEHRTNPDLREDQLSNILWFTFCSLFFAQGERIRHKYTRVVVVLWFLVMVFVAESYAAGLSLNLNVSQPPNVESLRKSEAVVGCFGNDVIREFLVNVLHFKREYIRDDIIATQSEYVDALKSGTISAAFLQAPYAKTIVKQYCGQLTITGPTYEFGGFRFIFPKAGSSIAANVSEAILRLMEDGTINKLEDYYFTTSSDCSSFQTTQNNSSLSLQNFSVLYLFYVAISSVCLLLFIKNEVQQGNITLTWASVWNKILRLERFLINGVSRASVWNKILGLIGVLNHAISRDSARSPTSDHDPNYDIEMSQTPDSLV
ncbi:glutamate receptor 2.8-like [Cornus florida]|uniref:glutamate receptor 2.8-like n=1 Tax=Cornus florida TaxID=4283 RepID=UPI00289DB97D|nr:glutamate receptor 2.8-like [Cornus florida]